MSRQTTQSVRHPGLRVEHVRRDRGLSSSWRGRRGAFEKQRNRGFMLGTYDAAVGIAAEWVIRAGRVIAAGAACLGAVGCAAAGKPDLPLRLVADVPLSGTASRFDYQSLDQVASRLYVSHLADG